MSDLRRIRTSRDESVGWISLTDLFLLSFIFVGGLIAVLAERLETAEKIVAGGIGISKEEYEKEQAKLERLQADLDVEKEKTGNLEKEKEKLKDRITALEDEIEALEKLEVVPKSELEAVRAELLDANTKIAELQKKLDEIPPLPPVPDEGLPHELLGLKGKMNRVLFLFDCSHSMRRTTQWKQQRRWEEAKQTARTWLTYLPVREAALVVFSETVRQFPGDGSYLSLAGRHNEFIGFLDNVEFQDETNTLGALERALAYPDVTSIILFTDGKPTISPRPPEPGQDRMKQIYAWLDDLGKKRALPPINVVAVGDYFEPKLRDFLLELSSRTKGSFRGR